MFQKRRVLMVYRGLDWLRAEGAEIRELVAGVLEGGGDEIEVLATDGRQLRNVAVQGGELRYGDPRPFSALWREGGADVAYVHLPIPGSQVAAALRLRMRGVPIVVSPMSMLGRDFGASSWFRDTSAVWRMAKPAVVGGVRGVWGVMGAAFVCASQNEIRQASLPPRRCALAPLPAPRTPLASASGAQLRCNPDGPVAVVSRFDVHRKGIDRVLRWLETYQGVLPRPAVLLFAPAVDDPPSQLVDLIDEGLVEWDTSTSGADLAGVLGGCRAVMLLSRYEGMPRVLREVALLGAPIITTVESNFEDALRALGADGGLVVDGDDPRAVHEAFQSIASHRGAAGAARRLFDRRRIGAFLVDNLEAVATGMPLSHHDYYRLPLSSS